MDITSNIDGNITFDMTGDMKWHIKSLKNVLMSKLLHLGIIKNGLFTLKNGSTSNIYMDFRLLINYPNIYNYINTLLIMMYPELLDKNNIKLMPIPMGGLPFGNYLSFQNNIPQIMVRDKPKIHGTKKIIEGVINLEDNFLIVEDVITTGISIKETLNNINAHNIKLNYYGIICICNRGTLTEIENIPIYNILTLNEILDYVKLLVDNNTIIPYFKYDSIFSNHLYSIALQKKSNLILSCDFMNNKDILNIINILGHFIVAIKLHIDTLQYIEKDDYDNFFEKLSSLKIKYNFLTIEDSKYADIESIMIEKINYSIFDLSAITNAFTMHAISGLSILKNNKLFIPPIIVAEMSSDNNMIDYTYTTKIIHTIRNLYTPGKNTNTNDININIGGIVCQSKIPKLIKPYEILTMSPGVNLESNNDGLDQKYTIPNLQNNRIGLFWIVGRGITKYYNSRAQHNAISIPFSQHDELLNKTELYRQTGWDYFIMY